MADQIVPRGPADAQYIDAPVRLEVLVFNGDNGLAQDRCKVVVVDHLAPLDRKRANHAPLPVVKLGDGRGAIALQVVNLRQID